MEYNFQDMIDRIKTQKKLKGVTNKELSESSGVPYGTLHNKTIAFCEMLQSQKTFEKGIDNIP